jgi:hypothetical protein
MWDSECGIANVAIILLSIYKRRKYVVFRQVGLLTMTDRTNVDISIPLKKRRRDEKGEILPCYRWILQTESTALISYFDSTLSLDLDLRGY